MNFESTFFVGAILKLQGNSEILSGLPRFVWMNEWMNLNEWIRMNEWMNEFK